MLKSIEQLMKSLREGVAGQGRSAATTVPAFLPGRFVKLGLSIWKEDLDEAQREGWRAFPRELLDPGQS
jgi:hypothetical protein